MKEPTTLDSYEPWRPLGDFFARRLLRRLRATGRTDLDLDDLRQEVAMTWVQCRAGFDPAQGAKFSTYWTRAVDYWWLGANNRVGEVPLNKALSLNAPASQDEDSGGDELIDLLIDEGGEDPNERLQVRANLARMASRKSVSMAMRCISLITDPPDDLREELEAARSQVLWAHERGVEVSQAHTPLTPQNLIRIFGLNWRQRGRLLSEMAEIAHAV